MRLDTQNQPEHGIPARPSGEPEQPGETRRRLTLSTEEMERLAELVDQMRERH